jgi:uncharacterized protein (DUF302 family)
MTLSDDIRFVRSNASFETTLQRLRQALVERGITLFAEIDHARNARDAGIEMPPTVVLIFGNAKAGTPLMLKAPDIALELPLRVLVREQPDGVTVLAYHDPARLAEAFHVEAVGAAGILGLSSLVAAVAAA